MVLTPSSESLQGWQAPTSKIDVFMQFIMFNVTNSDAVISRGEKPRLEEVGPFSYRLVQLGSRRCVLGAVSCVVCFRCCVCVCACVCVCCGHLSHGTSTVSSAEYMDGIVFLPMGLRLLDITCTI